MEVSFQPDRVLLPVEDDGSLRPAETGQGCRIGIEIETSLHTQLVSASSTGRKQRHNVTRLFFFPIVTSLILLPLDRPSL